jgi:hypothetical protein
MALVLLATAAAAGADSREDITRRLETPVSVDFQGVPLSRAVETVGATIGLPVRVLEGGELSIRLKVRDLRARSVLQLVLRPHGLQAVYQDGMLVVRGSCAEVLTRIYDARSKVAKLRDFRPSRLGFGPPDGAVPKVEFIVLTFNDEICCRGCFEDFLDVLLRENSGGRSWEDDRRVSLCNYDGLLFVTQTAAVHREIEALLARLPN